MLLVASGQKVFHSRELLTEGDLVSVVSSESSSSGSSGSGRDCSAGSFRKGSGASAPLSSGVRCTAFSSITETSRLAGSGC
jgi:hypothetical protein